MSSFGRGSLAIKTAEQGSGLGLPIVKGPPDEVQPTLTTISPPGGVNLIAFDRMLSTIWRTADRGRALRAERGGDAARLRGRGMPPHDVAAGAGSPPGGVNLIAFDRMLSTIWRTARSSAHSRGSDG
jgi:hypothetical protein